VTRTIVAPRPIQLRTAGLTWSDSRVICSVFGDGRYAGKISLILSNPHFKPSNHAFGRFTVKEDASESTCDVYIVVSWLTKMCPVPQASPRWSITPWEQLKEDVRSHWFKLFGDTYSTTHRPSSDGYKPHFTTIND